MFHIIVNPAAASGKGYMIWYRVKELLDEKKIEYHAHILEHAGQAIELVADLTAKLSEDCHLLVLGGDGTMNEVLNGIQNFEHTKVSCIRMGSGNDFARNMQIEKNPIAAMTHLIETPEEQKIDYGVAEYNDTTTRFIISSGIGYDADICEEVSRSKLKKLLNKVKLGKLVYVAIGIKQIFSRAVVKGRLYLDDKEPVEIRKLFFTVGMIHPMEGGGVPFCPKADPTDGKLDVCLVRNMSKTKLLLAVALVYIKQHLLFRNITNHRCKVLRLETDQPQWLHLDGETPCQVERVTLQCKQGLRFVK